MGYSGNVFYPGLVSDVPGASVAECQSHIMGYLACLETDGLGPEELDKLQTLSPQMREAVEGLVQTGEISIIRMGGKKYVYFTENILAYRAMGLADK